MSLLLAALLLASGSAVVKETEVAVYAGMSSKTRIVQNLRRGDVVSIDFSMAGPEGSWCSVIPAGQKASAGYVPCDKLNRPELSSKQSWRTYVEPPAPAKPVQPPQPVSPRVLTHREREQITVRGFDVDFWAGRLGFTESQRSKVADSHARSGAGPCFRQAARMMADLGVYDLMSMAMLDKRFGKDLEPVLERCPDAYGRHWAEVASIMTESQATQFKQEIRQSTAMIQTTVLFKIFAEMRRLP